MLSKAQVENCNVEHLHLVEMKQFGRRVVCKSVVEKAVTDDDNEQQFRMTGKIYSERFFTGLWESTKERSIYHGTFLFSIHPNGKTMSGKFLGIGYANQIRNGKWEGKLISEKTDKFTKKQLVDEFCEN